MRVFFLTLFSILLGATALAAQEQAPRVAADIGPVASLVQMVTQDRGEVSQLVPSNASAHDFALRPSQARVLQNADVVFWIGQPLTPWLSKSIENLAPNAISVPLLALDVTEVMAIRPDVAFANPADHDEVVHEAEDLSQTDPHAWLAPQNAVKWLFEIAKTLGDISPANREFYLQNAEESATKIRIAAADISYRLGPVRHVPFVLAHDGTQYFEHAFDLTALASIRDVSGSAPSVRRLQNLGEKLQQAPVACALQDAEMAQKVIILPDGSRPAKIGTLRVVGQMIEQGPDLYITMLNDVADTFITCLTP